MGIPSYFSYIVKNHPEIIVKYCKNSLLVHNLYLDSNSIVYDVYSKLAGQTLSETITFAIMKDVCKKIDEYIFAIQPTNRVIIAFDGVAPVAKLNQQRERRYKSNYQNEISRTIYKKVEPDAWNTAAITPGTTFMKELGDYIKQYFHNPSVYSVNQIYVSTSEQVGEGEHKIFEYIRKNPLSHKNETTIIYGLDADLIMLSIHHLPVCPSIYLFRETPHFIQSIDKSLEPNLEYLLDIPLLTKNILAYMNNDKEVTTDSQQNKIYDYIFLSFFLGNDFMPHFPAINIRTGGMDKMLTAYRETIKEKEYLTDGNTIQWNAVRKMVIFLANNEETYLLQEYKMRDKKERFFYPEDTPANIFKKFEAIPTYEREVEKYIQPSKEYWHSRYYRSLFDIKSDSTGELTKDICLNYLEGLEWTLKYYTNGCPDWRWSYKYKYPPLLIDLLKYIPAFNTTFVPLKPPNPVTQLVQLCYVLPYSSLRLLPKPIYDKLLKEHPEWYKTNYEFLWAFCKYFWESHVLMEEIDIDELERIVNKKE